MATKKTAAPKDEPGVALDGNVGGVQMAEVLTGAGEHKIPGSERTPAEEQAIRDALDPDKGWKPPVA